MVFGPEFNDANPGFDQIGRKLKFLPKVKPRRRRGFTNEKIWKNASKFGAKLASIFQKAMEKKIEEK